MSTNPYNRFDGPLTSDHPLVLKAIAAGRRQRAEAVQSFFKRLFGSGDHRATAPLGHTGCGAH